MFRAVIGKIGVTELLIILLIVLVVFGPKQLPKLSETLGKTIKGFKKGMDEEKAKEEQTKEKEDSAE